MFRTVRFPDFILSQMYGHHKTHSPENMEFLQMLRATCLINRMFDFFSGIILQNRNCYGIIISIKV